MAKRLALLASAVITVAAQSAFAQDIAAKLSSATVGPPPITAEQRARLAEKLNLIDQIVRSVDRELAATDASANTRKWLLESLLPLSLEQVRAIGMPGTLAATTSAIGNVRSRPELKSLGSVSSDLTYTPFSPCRFIDTRNVGGKIAGSRLFDLSSDGATYGGNVGCAPVTLSGASLASDVAALAVNMTIVDTSTAAAPGFATIRPAGSTALTALVNWTTSSAGFQLGNAAVVTSNQGSPNQVEILTSGSVQAIVDVFGAFLRPGATALDCTDTGFNNTTIAAATDNSVTAPACPAGRFPTGGECFADNGRVNLVSSEFTTFLSSGATWSCGYHNFDSTTHNIWAYNICCRVPGR